jgi:hypothetical protein
MIAGKRHCSIQLPITRFLRLSAHETAIDAQLHEKHAFLTTAIIDGAMVHLASNDAPCNVFA